MGGQFLDFMGGYRAHGGPPPPPTRENPGSCNEPCDSTVNPALGKTQLYLKLNGQILIACQQCFSNSKTIWSIKSRLKQGHQQMTEGFCYDSLAENLNHKSSAQLDPDSYQYPVIIVNINSSDDTENNSS